jgi:long-chain acyl-CoA synthetase
VVAGSAGTVPAMLLGQARERGGEVALRDRHRGRMREITWAQYARRTAQVGLALAELGIEPGDRVAIQSHNRPEWIIADLAVQGIGAISIGIEPLSPARDVEYLLGLCEARLLLVEDEAGLARAFAARERLPALERIIVMDARRVRRLGESADATLAELEAVVPARSAVEDWATHVANLDASSVATIVPTAGTTGPPRGVMLTHANLTWAAAITSRAFAARPDDEAFSSMSLCHLAERVASVATAVRAGYAVNFGEGNAPFSQVLRDVQPTIFIADPRVWTGMLAGVEARLADARRDKRVRRRLRKQLGLSRVRVALAAAAPIGPWVLEELAALEVEVRELYGLTESTFVCTFAPPGQGRPGTVGRVLDGVEVRIVADDEIHIRSPGVFAGYFGDEAAAGQAIDSAGWLRTGDRGMFEPDGFLTITGRKPRVDPE